MCNRILLSLAALANFSADPPALAAADAEGPAIRVVGDHIDFRAGKELVGRYHIGKEIAKPYFWPLNDPHGRPITRGWPMVPAPRGGSKDHPHQKSAWFCHGDVIPEGIEIKQKIKGVAGLDFWSEARGHGKIVCTRVDTRPPVRAEGSSAHVVTQNEWQTPAGQKILDETRTIGFSTFGTGRLLVFDIDLHASAAAITFGDTKEGAFGIRVNDALREKGGKGKLVNADGKIGMRQVWGQHSAWCDYSGPLEGKTVGIAIFDHPSNRSPASWHSRDYGLMAANPFGRAQSGFPAERGRRELVGLARGQHLKLRYALLIHAGDVKEGQVAEVYQRYLKLKVR